MKNIMNTMELFSESLWIKSIRRGLILLIPLIITGSLALVVNNLPLSGYQEVAILIFGEGWKYFGNLIDNLTFGLIGLALAGAISYTATEEWNRIRKIWIHPFIVALLSVICFFMLTNHGLEGLNTKNVGNSSIFIAIVAAIAATELFIHIHQRTSAWVGKSRIDSDPVVIKALSAMVPFFIVIALFAGIRIVLDHLGIIDVNDLLSGSLEQLFLNIKSPLVSIIAYLLLSQLFWFFGIHGSKLLFAVNENVYLEASKLNEMIHLAGGVPDNIVTKSFLDAFIIIGGSGATISLILAILLLKKQGNSRDIAKISVLPSIFNINEMILFGLPIVLNPFLLIPFIFVPVVLALVSYSATLMGIVPVTVADVIWTTPPLLSGYTATGSFRGILMQIFNIGLGVILYMPFIKLHNNYRDRVREQIYRRLVSEVITKTTKSDKLYLSRNDELGLMARSLVRDMRRALVDDSFYLKYQPQVNETSGILGFEALLRWNHPRFGEIPPLVMVALAEEADLMNDIGCVVIKKALYQKHCWKSMDFDEVRLSINLSPSQLADTNLLNTLDFHIREYNLEPELVELEFTETVEIVANMETKKVMSSLKNIGFRLAMDDFGMGHTSLLYLRHFSLDTIKIDGSLTVDVINDRNCQDIISSLVHLSRSTGAKLVAEYVETHEQWEMLKSLGCKEFQGYLFSPPVSADKTVSMLENQPFFVTLEETRENKEG